MQVHVADADLLDDLCAHLRASGFLIVRVERETIDAQPLNSVSDRHDRLRLGQQLDRWTRAHPQAAPTID